jgi:hypothetical protein
MRNAHRTNLFAAMCATGCCGHARMIVTGHEIHFPAVAGTTVAFYYAFNVKKVITMGTTDIMDTMGY